MSKQPEEGEIRLEAIRHPEVHYERTDLSPRGIYVFLLALVIAAAFVHLVIWGLWRHMAGAQAQPSPPRTELVKPVRELGGDPGQRFPTPRLQPEPVTDMDKFRAQVEDRLNSYGWVDEKAGIVHIPIERAIELTVQRGLAARKAAPPEEPRAQRR